MHSPRTSRGSRVAVRAETPVYPVPWWRGRVASWLTTVDHKRIGILYIATSLVFFGLGGILALLMRAQLATPNEHVVTKDSYNELFTMHGTTMIFLVIVPILAGFGNFLVPLMIGARDMAFPRLNALSYWLYLMAGVVLYASFFAKGGSARAGWTSYVTLSTLHEPGRGQDVFWFFGHPEVYIMILPAMGMISEIIPVFARKPIFGYTAVAWSTVGIAFYSMLVWAHHMFAVGLPTGLDSFFMISSMIIAVPTGVKIFNWVATLWRGNISFDTPMLWAVGFIAVFTIGGLSGIFLAAFPIDWQLTDTYYVVAHIHYVLFGGSIFAIFG